MRNKVLVNHYMLKNVGVLLGVKTLRLALKCSAPRGPEDGAFQHLVDGINYGMVLFYVGQSLPTFPLTDHTPTKCSRNEEIRARYAAGENIGYLARLFDISEQRISQIILGQRK